MLVNILNICSDEELVSGQEDELEEGQYQKTIKCILNKHNLIHNKHFGSTTTTTIF